MKLLSAYVGDLLVIVGLAGGALMLLLDLLLLLLHLLDLLLLDLLILTVVRHLEHLPPMLISINISININITGISNGINLGLDIRLDLLTCSLVLIVVDSIIYVCGEISLGSFAVLRWIEGPRIPKTSASIARCCAHIGQGSVILITRIVHC